MMENKCEELGSYHPDSTKPGACTYFMPLTGSCINKDLWNLLPTVKVGDAVIRRCPSGDWRP